MLPVDRFILSCHSTISLLHACCWLVYTDYSFPVDHDTFGIFPVLRVTCSVYVSTNQFVSNVPHDWFITNTRNLKRCSESGKKNSWVVRSTGKSNISRWETPVWKVPGYTRCLAFVVSRFLASLRVLMTICHPFQLSNSLLGCTRRNNKRKARILFQLLGLISPSPRLDWSPLGV